MMYGTELARAPWEAGRLGRVQHAAHQVTPRHGHDHACLHVVLRGLYVEHSRACTIVAGPGDLVCKEPQVEHSNHFGTTGAESLRFELPDPAVLAALRTELASAEGLERMLRRAGVLGPSERHAVAPQVRLLRLLRHAFRDPVVLGELAVRLGVHRSHLTRQFTRDFGCSPQAYVALKRAAWAAEELARGGDTLAAIAHAAGFADQAHLTRTFKRAFGATPGRWSRRARW